MKILCLSLLILVKWLSATSENNKFPDSKERIAKRKSENGNSVNEDDMRLCYSSDEEDSLDKPVAHVNKRQRTATWSYLLVHDDISNDPVRLAKLQSVQAFLVTIAMRDIVNSNASSVGK